MNEGCEIAICRIKGRTPRDGVYLGEADGQDCYLIDLMRRHWLGVRRHHFVGSRLSVPAEDGKSVWIFSSDTKPVSLDQFDFVAR